MEKLFNEILNFDTNQGGLNAGNGFDFQYACALSDIVDRYVQNKNFIVCVENVDDYIILEEDNSIIINQCKNYKSWACNTNNILKKPNGKESIWQKMIAIYKRLKLHLGNKADIKYMLIINKRNNISIIVESENKEAYKTEKFVDYLQLDQISKDSKKELEIDEKIDFTKFSIKRLLSYDNYDSEVQSKLYNAINDKKGIDSKYNPITLYNTLLAELKQKSKQKIGLNLQTFIKVIDALVDMQIERFLSYPEVKDYNNYSKEFDKSKLSYNYNKLKAILNSNESKLIETQYFNRIKTYSSDSNFDNIVESCKKDTFISILSIEELLAYTLLIKGEKNGINN